MKKLMFVFLFLSLNASACGTMDRTVAMAHSTGGRVSVHGMVVFGSGPYFIEHIPMLHPPHDFQIVATVQIQDKNGNKLNPDFSKQGFSFQPAKAFSLEDFMAGEVTQIEGSIHQGSFEQGGPIVPGFESVNLVVAKLNLVRQLPSESTQNTFEVRDLKNTYQTNIITPKNSVQNIQNKTAGKNLWCVVGPDFFDFCKPSPTLKD